MYTTLLHKGKHFHFSIFYSYLPTFIMCLKPFFFFTFPNSLLTYSANIIINYFSFPTAMFLYQTHHTKHSKGQDSKHLSRCISPSPAFHFNLHIKHFCVLVTTSQLYPLRILGTEVFHVVFH